MEFRLLGRKISVRKTHFILVLAAFLLVAIVSAALVAIIAFVLPPDPSAEFGENFLRVNILVVSLVMMIGLPLSAFLFLRIAPFFKLKIDVSFCRSCAAAYFILSVALALLIVVLGYSLGFYYYASSILIEIIGSFIEPAAASFMIYLWMLLFLKPEMRKIKKAGVYAVVFAVAMLLIWESYTFFTVLSTGSVYAVELEAGLIWRLLDNIIFAVVLLYHIPKKLDKASYLFVGLFLANYVLHIIMSASIMVELGLHFANAALSLVIIGILGRQMHRGKALV